MSVNNCLMIGRVCADPERRETSNGVVTAIFRIAVQRRYANADGSRDCDFINCKAWRHTAEFLCKYVHKGDLVCADGPLYSSVWTDKEGHKRITYEINADAVELLVRKQNEGFTAVADDDNPFIDSLT